MYGIPSAVRHRPTSVRASMALATGLRRTSFASVKQGKEWWARRRRCGHHRRGLPGLDGPQAWPTSARGSCSAPLCSAQIGQIRGVRCHSSGHPLQEFVVNFDAGGRAVTRSTPHYYSGHLWRQGLSGEFPSWAEAPHLLSESTPKPTSTGWLCVGGGAAMSEGISGGRFTDASPICGASPGRWTAGYL